MQTPLPPLTNVTNLNISFLSPQAGDYFVLDQLAFTATTSISDTAEAAFVWSYGMLLNNWDADSGLVRDRAESPSGDFDAIQATGGLAAATAQAVQLGIVETAVAQQIVNQISHTLLISIPRSHESTGLWPHFVEQLPNGTFTIATNTEWSSVDTVIAAIGLLEAQGALNLDTSGTISLLQGIDWAELRQPSGLSHGYAHNGALLTATWDTFGGESWLVELAATAATGHIGSFKYPYPPTANGSGFIDELAWLFVPPPAKDVWGADWGSYRPAAALTQTNYYTNHYSATHCFNRNNLFGLSAGEVPTPWTVTPNAIYQAFGVGGQHAPAFDGSPLLGAPVVVPHYSAMIPTLQPTNVLTVWHWLINDGPFSPLNNIESLLYKEGTGCGATDMQWNHLKGSWNLVLQTLGWGNYLAIRAGEEPILWQMGQEDTALGHGYDLLTTMVVLSKHSQPNPVIPGQPLVYTIEIVNMGQVTLTATVTDILPLQVSPTGIMTWPAVTISPNHTTTLTYPVTAPMGYSGTLTNVVQMVTEEGITAVFTHTTPVSCHRGPLHPPTASRYDLDEFADDWGIYCENEPEWNLTNVITPSLDGWALQCSLTGGTPYSNIHCYRNLRPQPQATTFTFTVPFRFTPATSCNNDTNPSIVQALEFSLSKWYEGKRYELALQWQNVGDGAPQWRYWDANQPQDEEWIPINPTIDSCLIANQWYTFTLHGKMMSDTVYYQYFSIDHHTYPLNIMVDAVSSTVENGLAIAAQLDGNAIQSPYNLYLDQVSLTYYPMMLYLPFVVKNEPGG